MWVIVVGNPVAGYKFVGPFTTMDKAVAWANEEPMNEDWCVAQLQSSGEALDR